MTSCSTEQLDARTRVSREFDARQAKRRERAIRLWARVTGMVDRVQIDRAIRTAGLLVRADLGHKVLGIPVVEPGLRRLEPYMAVRGYFTPWGDKPISSAPIPRWSFDRGYLV